MVQRFSLLPLLFPSFMDIYFCSWTAECRGLSSSFSCNQFFYAGVSSDLLTCPFMRIMFCTKITLLNLLFLCYLYPSSRKFFGSSSNLCSVFQQPPILFSTKKQKFIIVHPFQSNLTSGFIHCRTTIESFRKGPIAIHHPIIIFFFFNRILTCNHRHLAAFQSPSRLFSTLVSSRFHASVKKKIPNKTRIFLPHLMASMEVEESYIMIKPDGVQRGLVGEIISWFENKGFKLKGLKLFQCPKELAEEHYKDLISKPFFPKLISYISSGPVVCMAWEGVRVVASARKLIRATIPLKAGADISKIKPT
ncbi:putative nucleoside-diphosphate kinase [Helianthus annuus]|nr:putative nucleoside-diphosphate kinase [Helianthus annuus]